MTSQNVWNMSLFEHFFQGFEFLFGSLDPDAHQSDKRDPDPRQGDADPQHSL
jgi:hypothetical protein